ncbi:PP2C family protein-serine/threonine phosphatase [Streptomyces sp. NBC_01408]|uniref:PP2C family protein-serine/threonine phosphatase n=1 Tax=Streptomyces sp. NBC_01408 TaxID=2903855 RepID=UPI00225243E8|nr:PP2C family protein-serine/threonine phosphatase [Streptomyces sp. NBC_01408]MCX4695313.1 serine/threonine-protein phosphatase [Streptomyces sp. NBC_01408]
MDLRPPRTTRTPRHRPRRTGHAQLAVPFALIALVTVVDILAPPEVHLGPFLVAAPAITASFAGPWMTGFVGLVAVLAQVVVAAVRTSLTDLNHTFQVTALIMISVFVTLFAHLREVHEKELIQLRSVAETAQQVVLRPLREQIGPLRVASVYLAAAAEAQIGGDLYAAARTATGTRLIIGDVRGKGLEAVGDAALALGAFRASAHQEADLPALVTYLEGAVSPDLDDPEDRGESFITAAVLDIPDREPVLHLVSCGHPPPLMLHGGRAVPLTVDQPAPPLGLAGLVESAVAAQSFGFAVGDVLLLYTDGVLEARDSSGAFFPLGERAAARFGQDPHTLLDGLCADLLAHAADNTLGDDAAMVAIERLP